MQPLTKLFDACSSPITSDFDLSNITISHIAYDSREVKAGTLFVALKGTKSNGADYIDAAISVGAVALLIDHETALPTSAMSVPVIRAAKPRQALAQMAAAFYEMQPECIAAVTGTDGKTSTVHFLRQIWEHLGCKAASIGTLGFIGEKGSMLSDGSHTTPDPVAMHAKLMDLKQKGYEHVAMEASSHGLDQHRLDGLQLYAAAFTNLTREHLDYHGDMENYFQAKARLFAELLPPHATAVINIEDKMASRLLEIAKQKHLEVIEYGEEAKDLRIIDIQALLDGQQASLQIHGKTHTLHTPLVGNFQIYNMLAAMGLAMANGHHVQQVLDVLPKLKPVPGRLERVATHKNGAHIYIDYAHTPSALEKALDAMRPHTEKRLIVVFGAGGDRDKTKRPAMGGVAACMADIVIVTDDNPRTEDAAIIRKEILANCKGAKEVGDRKLAIDKAISMLEPGDSLLIAGKGHETYQIIGETKHPFNDAEVIREVLTL